MARTNVGKMERIASALVGAALGFVGARASTRAGRLLAVLGGLFAARAVTGHSLVYQALGVSSTRLSEGAGIDLETSVTVQRPVDEVYGYWKDLENLPAFMSAVESVETVAPGRTHWTVRGPAGARLEWDADLIQQRSPQVISWQSLPGSDIQQAGSVHFASADGQGTRVHLKMRYRPKYGAVGFGVARAAQPFAREEVTEDLRRFKAILETGETPTVAGQTHGAKR